MSRVWFYSTVRGLAVELDQVKTLKRVKESPDLEEGHDWAIVWGLGPDTGHNATEEVPELVPAECLAKNLTFSECSCVWRILFDHLTNPPDQNVDLDEIITQVKERLKPKSKR